MKRNRKTAVILQIVTYLAALLPLIVLGINFASGGLGKNPDQEATRELGEIALKFLILSLACTPLNSLFGWRQLLPLRKPLGLIAFGYAMLHLAIFTIFSLNLNLQRIINTYTRDTFVIVGTAAFLILLALAATSTRWSMKTLGKRWKQLHRFVYAAGVLTIIHYLMLSGKRGYTEPIVHGVVLGVLLLLRLPRVKNGLSRWRKGRRKSGGKLTSQI